MTAEEYIDKFMQLETLADLAYKNGDEKEEVRTGIFLLLIIKYLEKICNIFLKKFSQISTLARYLL